MGGGKSSQSTQQITIPPEVLARYNAVNATAEQAAATPFKQYSTDPSAFVAPLTDTQQAGITNTNAAAGVAQPYYGAATTALGAAGAAAQPYQEAAGANYGTAVQNAQPYQQAATGLAAAGAQAVNPTDLDSAAINKYISPYLQTVLQGTAGILNQQNQQQQAGQLGNAIRQGAFGGDRAGLAAANLEQQQNLANSQIYSGILNQGFNTALSTAQQQQGVGLGAAQANRAALQNAEQQIQSLGQQGFTQQLGAGQAEQGLGQQEYAQGANTSQQLAGLGAGAQTAALQGAQAQLGAGQVEQQTEQAGKQALYNQFLQQQSYPFQVAQFLANIAEGTGSLSGSTTTTTQPGGFFSDKRLKENIRAVGKTFDGQTIYSYNYKGGDKRQQIGLLAQDVEKKHPEAVGLAAGYKTVDYDKATDKSAKRGHFAGGGVAGYDPEYLTQMLAAQSGMYGPYLSAQGGVGTGAGSPYGGSSRVPSANLPVGHLAVAGGLAPQRTGLEQATQIAEAAKSLKGLYDEGKGLYDKASTPGASKAHISDDSKGSATDYDYDVQGAARGGLVGYADGGTPQAPIPGQGSGDDNLPIPKPLLDAAKAAGMLGFGKFSPISFLSGKARGGVVDNADDIRGWDERPWPFPPSVLDRVSRMGYAMGGMPYDNQTSGLQLDIPDDENKHQLMTAGPLPSKPKSGFSQIQDLAKTAAEMYAAGAKRGGAIHKADGGSIADLMAEAKPQGRYSSLIEALLHDDNDNAPPADMQPDTGDNDSKPTASAPTLPAIQQALMAAKKLAPSVAAKGSGTRAERNNNPGNIEDGKFAQSLPGYAGSDGRFAVFKTPDAGKDAQLALLSSYVKRGYDTPLKLASRWAPAGDGGNDPLVYANFIAKKLGIGPSDKLAANDVSGLGEAQARMEGWRKAYADGGAPADDLYDGSDLTANAPSPSDLAPAEPDIEAYSKPTVGEPANLIPANDKTFEAPHEGLGRQITDRLFHPRSDQTNLLLPILSGLAAMGTAPTRHLGVALAAGLGAGTQAYQGQREFGLEQQLAQARTAQVPIQQMQARTAMAGRLLEAYNNLTARAGAMINSGVPVSPEMRAGIDAITRQITALGIPVPNTSGPGAAAPPETPATGLGAAAPDTGAPAPSVPSASPAAAATPPAKADPLSAFYKQLAPERNPEVWRKRAQDAAAVGDASGAANDIARAQALEDAMTSSGRAQSASGESIQVPGWVEQNARQAAAGEKVKINYDYRTRAADDAAHAAQTLSNVQADLALLVDQKTGRPTVSGGPIGQRLADLGSLGLQFGFSPKTMQLLTGTDPTNASAYSKIQTSIASDIARMSLQGSPVRVGEFQAFMRANPGLDMPTAASYWILKNVLAPQAEQKAKIFSSVQNMDPARDDIQGAYVKAYQDNPWFAAGKTGTPSVHPSSVRTNRAGQYLITSPDDIAALPAGSDFVIPSGPNKGRIGHKG